MSQTAKAQEPSMEEILASIRRIIADDESGKSATGAPEPPPAPNPVPPVMAAPRPAPAPVTRAPSELPGPSKQGEIDAVEIETAKPEPVKPAPAPSPAPEALDLTEAMTRPNFRSVRAASDVIFAGRMPENVEAPRPVPSPPAAPAAAVDRELISTATRVAVDTAFNSLANTVLGNNALTLEDLVKEMLRPMLKSWLDDNLPGLVERLVRAEIERVSRGR